MSFRDCMWRAMDANLTDKERGQAATELWQETADAYERQGYPRHTAETMAAEDVKKALRRKLEEDRHRVMAQLSAERRNFKLAMDSANPEELPLRVLEASTASTNRITNVVSQMNALQAQFNGMLGEMFKHHSRDLLGRTRNKAGLRNIVKALHGEQTGDPMSDALAKSVKDTFERARLLFNAAGGNIGKLEDFGLPHRHNRRNMQEAGFDVWFDEIAPRLDWTRIENKMTGRPFSTDGLPPPRDVQRSFLREIFDTVDTDGWNKRAVKWGQGSGSGRASLYRRHSEERFLHFRSADDWLAYNERFGESDPFSAIVGHMHKMARDIALMRVMGPSHTAGLENLFQHGMKRVAGNRKLEDTLKANMNVARAMLDEISGASQTPHRENWARFFSGVRQTLSAAHLGSAVLMSGSDSVAMALAARSVGMNGGNVVSRHVKLLASSSTRETAAQMGYVADTLADAGNTMLRFLGETPSSEIIERMNSFVMRAQGLSFWTDMGRTAFQMEFAGELATAKTLNDLHPALSNALRQRGISDADWAMFSDPARHFTAATGERFASPTFWMRKAISEGMDVEQAERIALTIDGLAREYGEIAVPSINYEMRARISAVSGNARPGSIPGELQKSFMSYKSYVMTFSINQYRQIWAQPTAMKKIEYIALGAAGFTMMGALGMQLKEIAKGNDPRPMDDWKFWAGAGLAGGGLGIIGDLAVASETRIGGGLGTYIAGPMVGLVNDLGAFTIGNARQALSGEDTNIGREAVNLLKRNTPGTTLWPIRAALDRLLWDQMQLVLDPEADTAMRREVQRQQRDYGNGPYWKPAEPLPERLPSFSGG